MEIEDAHKERTGFTVGSLGFYEFNRMPFGLTNSPATYQRLMESCLGELNMRICFVYLDDLSIFIRNFEEHLEHLELVLERLKACNLKLAPEKCHFVRLMINFLGHVVSNKLINSLVRLHVGF